MMRPFFLWASNRHGFFRFVKDNTIARKFARRFVAGETVDDALAAIRSLNAGGISATLDLLGESVTSAPEAAATAATYETLLDRIASDGLDANVSVKLTALGQDISDAVCLENVTRVLERAKRYGSFVRLDMEGTAYTQRTLDMFEQHLFPAFPENVGIVLQSYLRRTESDVERAVAIQCRVRLCKGAYREPPTLAYPDKSEVDRNYVRCMKHLMSEGKYPGIATHDPALIAAAKRYATDAGISTDRFEFQMLYGVRRDLQDAIVREGFRMRVYVPFGEQWYPYLMRRLAERPANVWFMAGSVLRETFSRPA